MNRGQLEELAVRLHMIRNRYRVKKADKAECLQTAKVMVTRLTEEALIDRIMCYVDAMEVML